jgi:hypothetical protein
MSAHKEEEEEEVWYASIPKPEDGSAVEVRFKAYINELYEVDSVAQLARVSVFYTIYWKDDRIVRRDEEIDDPMAWNAYTFKEGIDPENIWIPLVEQIPGEGIFIILHFDFKGAVSANMNLKRFPFDEQIVALKFRSSLYPESDVVLVAEDKDKESMMRCKDPRVQSSEFEIRNICAAQKTHLYPMLAEIEGKERATYSEYRIEFDLRRKSGYYMNKIWVQFNFIMVMDLLCFLLLPSEIGDRNSVALTLFLTAVALSFAIAGDLPKISYLTRIDAFIIWNYILLFLIYIQNFFVYRWFDDPEEIMGNLNLSSLISYASLALIISIWIISNIWFAYPLIISSLCLSKSSSRSNRKDSYEPELPRRSLLRGGDTIVTLPVLPTPQ